MLWPTQNNIELNEISCDRIFWPWLVGNSFWVDGVGNSMSQVNNYILSIFLFYFTIHMFRDLPKIAKSKRIVKLLWRNFLIFLPCIHLKKNPTATYQVERIFNAHVWNVLFYNSTLLSSVYYGLSSNNKMTQEWTENRCQKYQESYRYQKESVAANISRHH